MAKPVNVIKIGSSTKIVFDNDYQEILKTDNEIRLFGNLICITNLGAEHQIPFNDIIDKHGTSTAEELLDYWGQNGYFKPLTGADASSITLTSNSTTTPLTAGSTFTGVAEDVSGYDSVVVAVKTDQYGSFSVQFSTDNINWDSILTRYYRLGQIEAPHRFTITRKYCRVVFTNDSTTDQTFLRLQTTFGSKGDLNAPIDSTLAQDFDSIAVRPTDFHAEVALGLRQGAMTWNKFGYNDNIDTGTEVLASWGGTYQFITVGETIEIVSTSTDDDDGGTGVNSIVVYGVDENWDEQTEVVTMNGTTTVTTTSQWIGINRVAVFLSGSGQTNAGDINVTATTSGYQMAQMPLGDGVTQQMIFFTPQNHVFLAEWLHFNAIKTSGGGNPEILIRAYVYSAVNNTKQEVFRGKMDLAKTNDLDLAPPIPFPISEKTIFWCEVETDTNDTQVSGRLSGELYRDKDSIT